MPQKNYYRHDVRLIILRLEKEGASLRLESGSKSVEAQVSTEILKKWREDGDSADVSLSLLKLFAANFWRYSIGSGGPSSDTVTPGYERLSRVTLHVSDAELSSLHWEAATRRALDALSNDGGLSTSLRQIVLGLPIVRISPVKLHAVSRTFTLPLRIHQIGRTQGRSIKEIVAEAFSPRPIKEKASDIDSAVEVRESDFEDLEEALTRSKIPTVEVLHFDHFSTLTKLPRLMSSAAVEVAGSLGWLSRLSDRWQTRLAVFHCDGPGDFSIALRFATALVNRGGPAVLVERLDQHEADAFYQGLYNYLIHDYPLDLIVKILGSSRAATELIPALFAGGGREEALRVSNIGLNLVKLANEVSNIRARALRARPRRSDIYAPESLILKLRAPLGKMRNEWATSKFEFQEGEGMLHLSRNLQTIRAITRPPREKDLREPQSKPRFVNSSLWSETQGGGLKLLPQKEARVSLGEVYHLGIQVGPKDTRAHTIGATALIEEVFKWTPEMRGIWVEVGVTGLDFEVLGEPVQDLWLPRHRASETIYFAIIPRRPGVSKLRFAIYYNQSIIQSFRLAALTGTRRGRAPSLATRITRLARALDIPRSEVGDAGYLTRLEYSTVQTTEEFETRPARALSIIANHTDGRPVITIKGADIFRVQTDNNLPLYISNVRRAMQEVSTPPINRVNANKWIYGFGKGAKLNRGTPEKLKQALLKMADVGWQLFDAIIPEDERSALEESLKDPGQTIHVAHVLLEKVIPWGAIYDRNFDIDKSTDENDNAVTHEVCLALLPDENGKLPPGECKKIAQCILHPDQVKRRSASNQQPVHPETVVCPLGFWGVKHIIEVPPQQVTDIRHAQSQRDCILAGEKVQLAAGLNAKLGLVNEHRRDLDDLCAKRQPYTVWKSQACRRDVILRNLKDVDLDIVYLYCHARGGEADPTVKPPHLEFQDVQEQSPGIIKPAALAHNQPWEHHPLVFLNGCGTAGFSPDALSPFITKLVRDRQASGVIGTEIPVWEPLASEFAKLFFEKFLDGSSAGEALLLVRRALLSEYNPLGLAYTLYGAAQLMLSRTGTGKCPAPQPA